MNTLTLILFILLGIGVFFNIIGVIGLLRFPDVYTRLHAETKTTTFGTIFVALSVAIYGLHQYLTGADHAGLALCIHVVIAIVVLAFTNATGSHAIAHAAYNRGQKPVQAVVEHLDQTPLPPESEEQV